MYVHKTDSVYMYSTLATLHCTHTRPASLYTYSLEFFLVMESWSNSPFLSMDSTIGMPFLSSTAVLHQERVSPNTSEQCLGVRGSGHTCTHYCNITCTMCTVYSHVASWVQRLYAKYMYSHVHTLYVYVHVCNHRSKRALACWELHCTWRTMRGVVTF